MGGVVTSDDVVVASDQSDSRSGVGGMRSLSPETEDAEVCERRSNDRFGTKNGRRSGVELCSWGGFGFSCGVPLSDVIERRVLSSGVVKVREGVGILDGVVS
jgi:hypothetical protein